MTPRPQDIALAEQIASEKNSVWGGSNWNRSYDAALAAIMAVRENLPDEIDIYRTMKGAGRKRSDMAKAIAASLGTTRDDTLGVG